MMRCKIFTLTLNLMFYIQFQANKFDSHYCHYYAEWVNISTRMCSELVTVSNTMMQDQHVLLLFAMIFQHTLAYNI
jgi:hypothetical protein